MSFESPDEPVGWECAKRALTEIQECPGEVQSLVLGVFDQLERFVEEFNVQERARQQTQRHAECEALQSQIDSLTAMVAELTDTVAKERKAAEERVRRAEQQHPICDYL
jgi:hypothetical protein